AVLVGAYEPGTEAWAKLRQRRLGGSEISVVFGYSPYESPFSLWHRKRGTITDELDNDLTWWGRQLEDDVAARFAYMHPNCRLVTVGTYVNRDRDYQLISTD